MRRISSVILTVVFLSSFSTPAHSQGGLEYSPMIGYDLDWEGLTIGFALGVPVNFDFLPVDETQIRPSAEYVFVGDQGTQSSLSVFRIAGEVLGAFHLDGGAEFRSSGKFQNGAGVTPFAKAGLAFERFSFEWDNDVPFVGGTSVSNSEVGLTVGGGAMINQIFVEGSLGIGNISSFRIAAGYTFGG